MSGNLEQLQDYYQQAYQFFSQGITLEEKKQEQNALDAYIEGLKLSSMALKLQIKAGSEWQKAAPIREKLSKYEQMIRQRVQEIQCKNQKPAAAPMPKTVGTPTSQQPQQQQQSPSSYFNTFSEIITNFFEPSPPAQHEYQSNRAKEVIDLTVPNPQVHYVPPAATSNTLVASKPPTTPKHQPFAKPVASTSPFLDFGKPTKQPQQQQVTPQKVVQPSPAPSPVQTPIKNNLTTPKKNTPKTTTPLTAAKPTPNSKVSGLANAPELKNVDKKLLDTILNEIVEDKPAIDWDDIAGLVLAKQTLYENVVLPSIRPDIFNGLRAPARGILLFGPPGNGKTLIAKAVAAQCKATFFSISASALVSKYHGEGEKLVKALFAAARYLQPSVIFVDEIDSILSARSSNEHEASRRMKTEFLVQMDGVNNQKSDDRVLVLAATNIPWELDGAVQRRFVKKIYIPLPDPEARKALIMNILANQIVQIKAKEMELLINKTAGYSGSDLKNLCAEAAMNPVRELGTKILNIKKEELRAISYNDFELGMAQVKASVAPDALKELEKWNAMFGAQASN